MNRVLRSTVKLANTNISCCEILGIRNCTSSSDINLANQDVPGLSRKIVDMPSGKVGFPGASKSATYKNPEYFCYHNTSFFEAEVEMMKYRLPQPSNKSDKK